VLTSLSSLRSLYPIIVCGYCFSWCWVRVDVNTATLCSYVFDVWWGLQWSPYYKFTAESAIGIFIKFITFGEDTGKTTDCLTRSVRMGTVLLKHEELATIVWRAVTVAVLNCCDVDLTWHRQHYQTDVDQFRLAD